MPIRPTYVELGDQFVHLWRFADMADGHMDEIHELRDRYRADVAVLIANDADGCGLATGVEGDEDEAFAVVHHACARTNFSAVHEIGYLIGVPTSVASPRQRVTGHHELQVKLRRLPPACWCGHPKRLGRWRSCRFCRP